MRQLVVLSSLLLSAAPMTAQFVREPVPLPIVDPAATTFIPTEMDSDGELTLAHYQGCVECLFAGGSFSSYVVASDGRGVDWSLSLYYPLQHYVLLAAQDPFGFAARNAAAKTGGDDHRLQVFDGTSWGPDIALETAVDFAGTYPSFQYLDAISDIQTASAGPSVHLHLFATVQQGTRRMTLVSSHDAGATFLPPLDVGPSPTLGRRKYFVDGLRVHHTYTSGPPNELVMHRASHDGGLSWVAPETVIGQDAGEDFQIAAEGDVVAVAWIDDNVSPKIAIATVSADGGLTFGPPTELGTLVEEPNDDEVRVAVRDGTVYVVWQGPGPVESAGPVVVRKSADAGVSWSPPVQLGLGLSAEIVHGPSLVFVWWNIELKTLGRLSRDSGETWEPEFLVHDPMPVAQAAYNARYDNIIFAGSEYHSPSYSPIATGLRPAYLDVAGFQAGPTTVTLDLHGFSGAEAAAIVLLSGSPGDAALPFGDGRNVGLTIDALFLFGLAHPSLFVLPLDASGAGSSPPIPTTLPAGATLHFAAVSFDSALQFAQITDVRAFTAL